MPTRPKFKDGFKTLVSFENLPTAEFWTKEIAPAGSDGGGKIDTTTMENTEKRTAEPPSLVETSDMTVIVAFNGATKAQIDAQINVKQRITTTFPDGTTEVDWGWISSFTRQNMVEKQMPLAEMKVVFGNTDNNGTEVGTETTLG